VERSFHDIERFYGIGTQPASNRSIANGGNNTAFNSALLSRKNGMFLYRIYGFMYLVKALGRHDKALFQRPPGNEDVSPDSLGSSLQIQDIMR